MATYQGESALICGSDKDNLVTVKTCMATVGFNFTDIIGFLGELGYAVITKEDAISAANSLYEDVRNLGALQLNTVAAEKHETWKRVVTASQPQDK